VLVEHANGIEKKAWPVQYMTMFHMTNDSHLFWSRERLEAEKAYIAGMGRWRKGDHEWLPLYEGKMVQAFDHRCADVVVNGENIHRPAQQEMLSDEEHADPDRLPNPQFWVDRAETEKTKNLGWVLGFKEITSPTNIRTMIAALMPTVAFGNKTPLLLPDLPSPRDEWLLVAEFNSFAHDYVVRQKLHGQTLNWFVVEQLPVLAPKHYANRFGRRTAADIVKDHVLRLTYTAHDMAPFARDIGYVNEDGSVKPPIVWDEAERRQLRARLDALYFILYGVTEDDDFGYILSTFPIVERKDRAAHDGIYLTLELILWYKHALEAGDSDAIAPEAEVIRIAKAAGRDAG
jgi:hypothetical protein